MVDKPAGWTSHDVVAKARGLLGTRKVGHSGTLDPDATGVLVLGVGRATRLLRYLSPLGKVYEGEIVLGVETSTLDASGEVLATYDMGDVTAAQAQVVVDARLSGNIEQVPPMVSSVKVGGRRLHELARAGVEVEREARPVHIAAFTVTDGLGSPGVLRARVECSAGTYVRVLAADLGHALGGGAHLRSLRRTAVGPFTLDAAVPLEALSPDVVRPPVDAVAHMVRLTVGSDLVTAVGHGKVLERDLLGAEGEGPWAVLDAAGTLLAVYEAHRGTTAKPSLVLGPPPPSQL